jgi:hypothetical protein
MWASLVLNSISRLCTILKAAYSNKMLQQTVGIAMTVYSTKTTIIFHFEQVLMRRPNAANQKSFCGQINCKPILYRFPNDTKEEN